MSEKEINFAIKFGCITSLVMGVVYPLMITTHGYHWYNYVFELGFGPLFIISYVGTYFFIRKQGDSFFNLLAVIFHVLAASAILLTNTVQKSVFTIVRVSDSNYNEISREITQQTFRVGNLVQLGMDFYFDVLVSIGTIFLSLALLKQSFYPKWIVLFGFIIGAGGLVLNTVKFPIPPADSGLFDPGPFFAVFSAMIFFPMIYKTFFNRNIS